MNARDYLDEVAGELKDEFDANRRVMSFGAYVDLFLTDPTAQTRNAAKYLLDCFQHYGSETLSTPMGEIRRWGLFDTPFDGGRDALVGQEEVQEAIYRAVQNFTRQRRVNKLIMLHGPNGSAKSSIIACLSRAMEAYSRTEEGAVYCFSWVFPSRKVSKKRLGFGADGAVTTDAMDTFANLEDEDVDARIPGDLRDHPLLLLPIKQRLRLLETARERLAVGQELALPEQLLHGELSPRNQQIAELLFQSYGGDLKRVLRHVQVQRFYISRRFRRGAVTVEPQIHTDASVRQLTGDRSLTSLPLILQSTTLYEPFGDLIDAHRGLMEYNDLLKRPIDTFKYLLATCEKSSVALQNQILHLDLLFFASSNETHLVAFKEYPDWPSFKGRIELVRTPYLRCYRTERQIYDAQVGAEFLDKPLAPHATEVAALWAVLTRLRKPHPERYPKELRGTVAALSPLQKADLYSTGKTPSKLPLEKARRLRAIVKDMVAEERADGHYEGQHGASPREMKTALLTAAQRDEYATVSPLAVLKELELLCSQRSVYGFLRMEPEGQYNDPVAFIEAVKQRWLDQAAEELVQAMGLVTREQYDELFKRYLVHVGNAGRGEKMLNPATGAYDEPDQRFMADMELHFGVEKDAEDFRSRLLGRIGAAIPTGRIQPSEYRDLFPDLFEKLEGSYHAQQRPTVRKIAADLLRVLAGDEGTLEPPAAKRAQATLDSLTQDFGYDTESAKETVSTLVSGRFQD